MKNYCSADDFMTELENTLGTYSDEVSEATERATKTTAKKATEIIKQNATFKGSGKYLKAFRLKKNSNDKRRPGYTWYVARPYHTLTYLLENGHKSRNPNKIVKAFKHIIYGEQFAKENLEDNIVEEINRGN